MYGVQVYLNECELQVNFAKFQYDETVLWLLFMRRPKPLPLRLSGLNVIRAYLLLRAPNTTSLAQAGEVPAKLFIEPFQDIHFCV